MSLYPCTGYGKSLDFALLPEVIANSCSAIRDSYPSRRAAFAAVLHTYRRRIRYANIFPDNAHHI